MSESRIKQKIPTPINNIVQFFFNTQLHETNG